MFRRWLVLLFPVIASAQGLPFEGRNLTTFSVPNRSDSRSTSTVDHHPDEGFLPYTTPCLSCSEDYSARSASSRRFVQHTSSGRRVFQQYASSPINYQDEYGYWREINPRLSPTTEGNFVSAHQPIPVWIKPSSRKTGLLVQGDSLYFNTNLRLIHRTDLGEEVSLGKPDWSDLSAGDDGVLIRNVYPGIDLVFTVREGQLETGFLLNQPLPFTGGSLVMAMDLQEGDFTFLSSSLKPAHQQISVFNNSGMPVAKVKPCFAFDHEATRPPFPLASHISQEVLTVELPVRWLNAPERSYPVFFDPVLTTQGVINPGPGGVTGSRYSTSCWTNGCSYSLSVLTPANASLQRVLCSFEYYAVTGICQAQDGGYSISVGACTAPSAAPGVFTCALPVSNYYCSLTNVDITADVRSCLPPDQCTPQSVDFTLDFFRCNNDTDTTCSSNCITATQPWIITLESRDLELPFITPDAQACQGDTLPLAVAAQYGVGPYSYSWAPTGETTSAIIVAPASSTTYSVTVTDQCGTTASATSAITLAPVVHPGFTLSADSVCTLEPVILSGGGSAPASSYQWIVPGSNASTGSISAQQQPTVDYLLPGDYPVTLRYFSGSCFVDSTRTLHVVAPRELQALMVANPSGQLCPGDPVTFTATSAAGIPLDSISFLLNGVMVSSGTNSSYAISTIQNGDLVQAVVTSQEGCLLSSLDTASLFMAVSGTVLPAVTIQPDVPACYGATVLFQASPVNGGLSPTYQWSVNGVPVPGATADNYTLLLQAGVDSVGVTMVSSLGCVSTTTATTFYPVANAATASVSLQSLSGDTLCAQGDLVVLEGVPVNPGQNPIYQWYLNGSLLSDTGRVLSSNLISPGDAVRLVMISDAPCVQPAAANSNTITFSGIAPLSLIMFGATPACSGEPILIQAGVRGGKKPYGFQWSEAGGSNDSLYFTPSGSGYVSVVVSDACGVSSVVDSSYVVVLPAPAASFSFSPGNPVAVESEIQFKDRSSGAQQVRWDFGDGSVSTDRSPEHTYRSPGTYSVYQYALSANGCIDTTLSTVIVSEDYTLYIPNAFTPNGDAINATWLPLATRVTGFDYIIIDRWGKKVFEGDEVTPWPGTFGTSERRVPPGVYNYRVTIPNGPTFTGRVTIIY